MKRAYKPKMEISFQALTFNGQEAIQIQVKHEHDNLNSSNQVHPISYCGR